MRPAPKLKEPKVEPASRSEPATHLCPSCDKVLSIGEFIERFCHECGTIQPVECRA